MLPIEDTRGEGDGVAIFSLSETERVFCESMRNYGEYKWQLFTSWELAWSKTEISKILSNRARQSALALSTHTLTSHFCYITMITSTVVWTKKKNVVQHLSYLVFLDCT